MATNIAKSAKECRSGLRQRKNSKNENDEGNDFHLGSFEGGSSLGSCKPGHKQIFHMGCRFTLLCPFQNDVAYCTRWQQSRFFTEVSSILK